MRPRRDPLVAIALALLVTTAPPVRPAHSAVLQAPSPAVDAPGAGPLAYTIFYTEDVRGIAAATASLHDAVAARLAADAGAHAFQTPAPSELARPFTVTYVTDIETDRHGKWIPGTHAIVQLNPLLAGQSAPVDLKERIVAAIEAHAGVRYVKRYSAGVGGLSQATAGQSCGQLFLAKGASAFCKPGLCCGASNSTCGDSNSVQCTSECLPAWTAGQLSLCNTWHLPREFVLGALAGKSVDNLEQLRYIDAIETEPNGFFTVPRRMDRASRSSLDPFARVQSGFMAMVVDSGFGPHTDVNIAGCRNFVQGSKRPQNDCSDDHGHGTSVAGLLAAINNGAGIIGVAPGFKVFVAKVQEGKDLGNISEEGILEALRYAYNQNSQGGDKIVVINISLGIQALSNQDLALKDDVCKMMASLQDDQGVVFTTAAGNDASANSLLAETPYWPRACPRAIVVTALDTCTLTAKVKNPNGETGVARQCTPLAQSNWAAKLGADDPLRQRTVMAPGARLTVLRPNQRTAPNGAGTSFASPLVGGIAARCFAAGDCKYGAAADGGGAGNMRKLLDYFATRNQAAGYRWTGPTAATATTVVAGSSTKYYGYLVSAGHW